MNNAPLTAGELEMLRGVLRRHAQVRSAWVFGSRAKGTHTARSDVDLAVTGNVPPLAAEAIASELEELPLPYKFEVHSLRHIQHRPLRELIRRVGIAIYPETTVLRPSRPLSPAR